MSAAHSEAIVLPRTPYDGGRRNMSIAAIVGVIGVVLWLVSMSFAPKERAVYSWLWAFQFWLTPCLGAIGWLCAFYAAKARWVILPRRNLELIAATVPIFVLLFVPVAVCMKDIYPWMRPEAFD
jgi:hypothetical protein